MVPVAAELNLASRADESPGGCVMSGEPVFSRANFLQKGIAYDLHAFDFCFRRVAGSGAGVIKGASLAAGTAGDS